MKIHMLVALATLVATASVHAETPESGPRHDPTRGGYLILNLAPYGTMSANWPCEVSTSYLCQAPTRIDYRDNGAALARSFDLGVGYTFNRYLAVEALGVYALGGSNPRKDTYMNYSVHTDGAFSAQVAIRGDLPITSWLGIYAKYGVGRQLATFDYDEQDYGSADIHHTPTTVFSKSFSGNIFPVSAGFSFKGPEGANLRLAYTRYSIGAFKFSAIGIGLDYVLVSTWH